MAKQEILIDIDEVGNVTVEGVGFAGADCKKFTEAIERELGEVVETTLKPEYRQVERRVSNVTKVRR